MTNLLLVQANPHLATTLSDYLVACKHTVRLASNASEAICATVGHRYQAIIIDTDLANGEGLRLLKHFRKRPKLGKLIAITTPNHLPIGYQPEQLGIAAVIEKPFHLASLNSMLLNTCSVGNSELKVAAIKLNTCTQQASVNGQPLLLTSHQLRLLKLFLQNPGQLLTETLLANHLCPQHPELAQGTLIQKHIGVLAQILRNANSALGIVPIINVGYRMQEV